MSGEEKIFVEDLLKAKTTEEGLNQSRNQLERQKNLYLKGVIDFAQKRTYPNFKKTEDFKKN